MKKQTRILVLFLLSLFVVLQGCKKEYEINNAADSVDLLRERGKGAPSFLGKKLNNPYSLKNMQKALNNLLDRKHLPHETISASHLYVRFKPHNEGDLSLLKQDTTLILYAYPLDYEIIEGTTTYRDPSVPKDEPTYQYASVPVDYDFPAVDYEILEQLYIPEQINDNRIQAKVSVEELVDEALRITGNLDENEPLARRRRWRPAGTIKVWDSVFNRYVPVKHLKVRARRWFTTYYGITDSNGHFSCNGTFRRPANYSLKFERYDFEIRKSWLGTANINGPKKKGDWNLYIRNGEERFWAIIFRATSHYYYENIFGLRRPPQNSFWRTQLKIRAFYESNNNASGYHCPSCRFLGLGSAIKIYNPQRKSRYIFATTIHELAHASHWNMDRWHYNNAEDIVKESWARGVEWKLTSSVYHGYQPLYARLNYTGIVQDMIDGFGYKGTQYWWDYENDTWGSPTRYRSYYDHVTGYTIRQIEDALIGITDWDEWKNNLKNLYNNATENYLDDSFSYWNTY